MASGQNINSADFDKNFIWGTATSAYQIEGAAMEGGRGLSIWDIFCLNKPERIVNGTNGNDAIKAYYKIKEDVHNMKKLGVNAYRFSLSWSRILPGGRLSLGINQEGVNYYNNLINELLANQIEPFVTIWQWDTPNNLQEEYAGFLSEKIIWDFTNYCKFCFWEFGDRVKHWITLNEPWSYALGGYVWGTYAPGRGSSDEEIKVLLGANLNFGSSTRVAGTRTLVYDNEGDPGVEPYLVARNLLLSHATAVKLYREKFQKKQMGKIGITLVSEWFESFNPNSPEDNAAVFRALDFMFGWFMQPLINGTYPVSMTNIVPIARLPPFDENEKSLLTGSYDFIGLNYYTSTFAKNASPAPSEPPNYLKDTHVTDTPVNWKGIPIGQHSPGSPDWFYVCPEGLLELLKYVKDKYGDPEIYITENGYLEEANCKLTVAQACVDEKRVKYLQDHLFKLKEAIDKYKVNVKGYFVWSLMDNFEWNEGYTNRFGLLYVDFVGGLYTRYPKDSALWFMDFLLKREVNRAKRTINYNEQATDTLKQTKMRKI